MKKEDILELIHDEEEYYFESDSVLDNVIELFKIYEKEQEEDYYYVVYYDFENKKFRYMKAHLYNMRDEKIFYMFAFHNENKYDKEINKEYIRILNKYSNLDRFQKDLILTHVIETFCEENEDFKKEIVKRINEYINIVKKIETA